MKLLRKTKNLKCSEFDIARLLKSKKAMTEYLNQVIADGDDAELAAALGHNSSFTVIAPQCVYADGLTKVLASLGHSKHPCFSHYNSIGLVIKG